MSSAGGMGSSGGWAMGGAVVQPPWMCIPAQATPLLWVVLLPSALEVCTPAPSLLAAMSSVGDMDCRGSWAMGEWPIVQPPWMCIPAQATPLLWVVLSGSALDFTKPAPSPKARMSSVGEEETSGSWAMGEWPIVQPPWMCMPAQPTPLL